MRIACWKFCSAISTVSWNSSFSCLIMLTVCCTSSGDRPTEGSSTSRMRGADMRARDREHLLLAAAHAARELPAALLEHRERRIAEREVLADRVPRERPERAEEQVLLNGELGKESPAFGHHRHPEAHDLLGRHAD